MLSPPVSPAHPSLLTIIAAPAPPHQLDAAALLAIVRSQLQFLLVNLSESNFQASLAEAHIVSRLFRFFLQRSILTHPSLLNPTAL